jgi:hypothetical protein
LQKSRALREARNYSLSPEKAKLSVRGGRKATDQIELRPQRRNLSLTAELPKAMQEEIKLGSFRSWTMKNNTAENFADFGSPSVRLADESKPPHTQVFTHASTLRTLGHVLENHHCSSFELRVENNDYVIRGKIPPAKLPKPSLLRSVRNLFSKPPAPIPKVNKSNEIELRYSPGDLQSLEAQVRSERTASPEAPNPNGTSQLLRGIGCYLDKRPDNIFVSAAVEDRWVTIVSRNRDGQLQKTQQDIEYFYDFWVKMYLQRSGRPVEPPQCDPTICVAH